MSGDLVAAFGVLREGGVVLSPNGLTIEDEISFEHYRRIGKALGALGDCVRFAAGDWILQGEALFGEDAADASDALGLAEDRLDQYRWVAEAIPPARRRVGDVPWSLHRLVAKLDPAEQTAWLDRAAEDRLTYRELKAQLDAVEITRVIEEPANGSESVDETDPTPTSAEVVEASETGGDAGTCPACGQPLPEQHRLVEIKPERKREPGS